MHVVDLRVENYGGSPRSETVKLCITSQYVVIAHAENGREVSVGQSILWHPMYVVRLSVANLDINLKNGDLKSVSLVTCISRFSCAPAVSQLLQKT